MIHKRKAAWYFNDYEQAYRVLQVLRRQEPYARIVSYEMGYAIQRYISGPYWAGEWR